MLRSTWWHRQWLKLRAKVPSHDEIFASRWLKPLAPYFNKPYFWVGSRRKVALAVGIGLFAGMMPGPTQMLTALLLAYVLRANLPVSLVTTLYTNPLTYLPLYYAAYELGWYVLAGQNGESMMSFADWKQAMENGAELRHALAEQARYLLVGVPMLSGSLAVVGYVLVRVVWRWRTTYKWRHRHVDDETAT